jgi:cell division protein FtsL
MGLSFLFVVIVGAVSISVSSATLRLVMASDLVSESIESAKADGRQLEIEHALATNPARIQEAAAALGMAPDNYIRTLAAASQLNLPQTAQAPASGIAQAPPNEAYDSPDSYGEADGLSGAGGLATDDAGADESWQSEQDWPEGQGAYVGGAFGWDEAGWGASGWGEAGWDEAGWEEDAYGATDNGGEWALSDDGGQ